MDKKIIFISTLLCLLITSCSERSPYYTTGVKVGISVKQVSAGIIQTEFSPDKEAFYYCGIAVLDSNQTKPYDDEQQYMERILTKAYAEYVEWKYKQIESGIPYIASFADHVLCYGKTEYYFINLWPDTRYFIYAFVVDPQSIVPIGQLYSSVVATTTQSVLDVSFDMTIDRDWDFVYPLDSQGELVANAPYQVNIVNKNDILEHFGGDTFDYFHKPAWYFLYNVLVDTVGMDSTYMTNPERCCFGASCRRHDGNNPEVVTFKENETYYASICSADGLFLEKTQTIYKFVWKGKETHIVMDHKSDNVGYHW